MCSDKGDNRFERPLSWNYKWRLGPRLSVLVAGPCPFQSQMLEGGTKRFQGAADLHRMLLEAYGNQALLDATCKRWFQRFRDNDFDVRKVNVEKV
ncbi:hypothetical protein TNCT_217791 [Trichonephila clavata]|uniref:Mos1 transposase HTH domain-containing protein n=1 Tax=Trichonephila clavata TaxID=2740835 RepID=A0A8X6M0U9_TRICU|nr:hypothetical protein TNCT_217791 [Trichonephila clavata]